MKDVVVIRTGIERQYSELVEFTSKKTPTLIHKSIRPS